MVKYKNNKSAFTLIELLVVVSIIALLVSILLPALSGARFQAKRVYCLTNIKNQHIAQFMYATDNNGKFAPHNDSWPHYYRSGQVAGSGYLHELMKDSYISDSKIFLCPLQKRMGGAWEDLKWQHPDMPSYAAWDYVDSDGNSTINIFTGYLWTANYDCPWRAISFVDNEPVWPKNDSECNARKAFITHDIIRFVNVGGNSWWYDHGHGGSDKPIDDANMTFDEASKSKDNPVGYADGHAEWTPRSQLKLRVLIGTTEFYY